MTSLFKWNSLMLALDDGNFVEYVHIRGGSARYASALPDRLTVAWLGSLSVGRPWRRGSDHSVLTSTTVGRVAAGERVEEGQPLCESGDVGFCPSPHLHIQLHASADDGAPTVPLGFRDGAGGGPGGQAGALYPAAGGWYGGGGAAAERCAPCG